MIATAAVRMDHQHVAVTLDAAEVDELRLTCDFSQILSILTGDGERYTPGAIRVHCISGIRIARRQLSLPAGLSVTVSEMSGVVDKFNGVGICHAVAIAIARALKKDPSLLFDSLGDWRLSE